jgi:hypothetical protein
MRRGTTFGSANPCSRHGIPARDSEAERGAISAHGRDLRVEAGQSSAQQLGITLAIAPLQLLKYLLARKLQVRFLHLELHFFRRAGAGFVAGGFGITLLFELLQIYFPNHVPYFNYSAGRMNVRSKISA